MWKWIRKHKLISLLFLLILGINFLAFMHAGAMLHFSSGDARTQKPEELSLTQKIKTLVMGVNIPRPENRVFPEKKDVVFISVNDKVRLEAWRINHPHPKGMILLFHGYASSKSSLLSEAQVFYDLGYSTLLTDFRGSGGSNQSYTTIGIHEAEDVAKVLESVKQRPVVLYGQSMGAAAVLRALERFNLNPDGVILESVFSRLLRTVENRFKAMGIPSFPCARLLVFWAGIREGIQGFEHNPMEYAKAVKCPTLMLHGQKDPRVSCDDAREVYENLKGVKSFVSFKGAEHQPLLKADPKNWKDAMSTFLSSLHP